LLLPLPVASRVNGAELGSGQGVPPSGEVGLRVDVSFILPDRAAAGGYRPRQYAASPKISCMLEVSGTAIHSQLTRRHRQKVAQAMANPLGWDAYVMVCVFSSRGHRIRFSFQSGQESVDDQTPA
jgi:hypothetical protein